MSCMFSSLQTPQTVTQRGDVCGGLAAAQNQGYEPDVTFDRPLRCGCQCMGGTITEKGRM
jgi:hypothetical protein